MSAKRPDNHHDREHRRKHLATWVAATGTLAVVVALWAMLLPTQLGGIEAFGMKHSPSWMRSQEAAQEESAPTYQEALDRMRSMLDKAEYDQRTRMERERAAREETDLLRERIESAAAEPETDAAEQTPQ